MASIRKRGARYEVQIRRQGFASITKSFSSRADAQEWARMMETKADRHELAPTRKELTQTTLGDLVTRYLNEVVPKMRAADNERSFVEPFLRHPICRKTLHELTTKDFARYRDERLQQVTPKSLQRSLSPINHMFKLAVEEWDIPIKENPLAKLRLKVVDNKRQRRIGAGELDRLLSLANASYHTGRNRAAIRTRNPYVSLVIEFAVETAMRRGEILALTWPNVDIERGSVMVLEAKNGHSRVIPLTQKAVSVLERARKLEPTTRKAVFPLSANGFRLCWERLVKSSEIHDLHFHDLRHEAISRLFEMGLTAPEVASISGHRTVSQLFRYAHASQASVRAKFLGSTEILSEKSTVDHGNKRAVKNSEVDERP